MNMSSTNGVAAKTATAPRFSMRDLLSQKAISLNLTSPVKKDVLQAMAEHAATLTGREAHMVFDVLWARERLGTTGVGQGIAIPHGRVAEQKTVQGFFARLATPIPFEAVDDKPVDLVFLLLSPEEAGADHLHALAIVSRLLRDPVLCDQLRKAKDEAAIYRLLTEAAEVEAA